MVKINPYVLVRLGGQSFSLIDKLKSLESEKIIDKILEMEETNRSLLPLEEVSKQLLFSIKKIEESRSRMGLIHIRRRLFNKLELSLEDINKLKVLPEMTTKLRQYLSNLEEILILKKLGFAIYNRQKQALFYQLRQLFELEELQIGLFHSSISVYNAFLNYLLKDNHTLLSKKDLKTQTIVIKYLSRMIAKTSPFSTLGKVAIGSVKSNQKAFLEENSSSIKKKKDYAYIRPNNHIFYRLLEALMQQEEFRSRLSITINPSAEKIEEKVIHFLSYNFNQESFQKLKIKPINSLIFQLLKEASLIPFNALIQILHDKTSAHPTEIRKYVEQLITIGLLEFKLEISPFVGCWERELLKLLSSLDSKNEVVKGIIKILEEIILSTINKDSIKERVKKVKNISNNLTNLFNSISNKDKAIDDSNYEEKSAYSLNPEFILYEDRFTSYSVNLSKEKLTPIVSSINELTRHLFPLNYLSLKRRNLYHLFLNLYGSENGISLMRFFEDYNRLQRTKGEGDLDKYNLNAVYQQFESVWERHFLQLLNKGEQDIFISTDDLKLLENELNFQNYGFKKGFFSCFMQFFDFDNETLGVLKSKPIVHPGYGKFLSRFLNPLPKRITDNIRKWNLKLMSEDKFLEISDWSYFNANSHPLLMPFELSVPKSIKYENDIDKQVLLSELIIKVNSNEEELVLIDKISGRRVFLFDLGFQAPNTRSKLFQFLLPFSKAEIIPVDLLERVLNQTAKKNRKDEIVHTGRIYFNRHLIVKRKSWMAPVSLIPKKEKEDSDWDYYFKINEWRKRESIPNKVFVHFYFEDIKGKATSSKKTSHKPQFIWFSSIPFVDIFEKSLSKEVEYIYIEEMLPDDTRLYQLNNEKLVSEFLVSWT